MAESGIILPADSTGKALRTETVTTTFNTGSGGVAHQQVVSLGDPTTAANLAAVSAGGALNVTSPDVWASGSISAASAVAQVAPGVFSSAALAANSFVQINCAGMSTVGVGASGTFVGSMFFEVSLDGTNWTAAVGYLPGAGNSQATVVAVGGYRVNVAGFRAFRVRSGTTWTSGTATIALTASPGIFALSDALPTGQNTIGKLAHDSNRTLYSATGTVTPTAGTEALLSLTPNRAGAAGSAATTGLGVTAGKTLRLTTLNLTIRQAATAAIGGMRAALRIGTGTLTISTPIFATIGANIATATANLPSSAFVDFPDGLELTGSLVYAVTVLGTAHPVDVAVTGFEY